MKKFKNELNLIGTLIKRRRIENGMSANDVCKKLKEINILMNKTELYLIESKQMVLKDFEMIALCNVLEIEFENIIKEFMQK